MRVFALGVTMLALGVAPCDVPRSEPAVWFPAEPPASVPVPQPRCPGEMPGARPDPFAPKLPGPPRPGGYLIPAEAPGR